MSFFQKNFLVDSLQTDAANIAFSMKGNDASLWKNKDVLSSSCSIDSIKRVPRIKSLRKPTLQFPFRSNKA